MQDLPPYDRIADEWHASRSGIPAKDQKYIDLLLAALPAKSRVLDLGCGTGQPNALHVMQRGHRIAGVDSSAELLAIARRQLEGAQLLQADMRGLRLEGPLAEPFDGALCWDALFHVQRSEHRAILRTLHDALRPGGRMILTTGGSNVGPFTDEMFGHSFFYDSHAPEETQRLVEQAGFEVVIAELVDRPDGERNRGRLAIVADRRT